MEVTQEPVGIEGAINELDSDVASKVRAFLGGNWPFFSAGVVERVYKEFMGAVSMCKISPESALIIEGQMLIAKQGYLSRFEA